MINGAWKKKKTKFLNAHFYISELFRCGIKYILGLTLLLETFEMWLNVLYFISVYSICSVTSHYGYDMNIEGRVKKAAVTRAGQKMAVTTAAVWGWRLPAWVIVSYLLICLAATDRRSIKLVLDASSEQIFLEVWAKLPLYSLSTADNIINHRSEEPWALWCFSKGRKKNSICQNW